jgi:hypothetical protein
LECQELLLGVLVRNVVHLEKSKYLIAKEKQQHNTTQHNRYNNPFFGRQNSAAVLVDTASTAVDGVRIHNAWDSIRPRAPQFKIRSSWISKSHDDAIEVSV